LDSRANINSHSHVLRSKIRLIQPRLQEQQSLFWNHPQFEKIFVRHLTKLYYNVSASIPLLKNARQRAQELSSTCPVAAALEPYFAEHIVEEHNHDQWLLEDLELLGVTRDSIISAIPPTDVALIVGSQYYYINHAHPVAMMAYLAVIEGSPPNVETLNHVVASNSIPKKALRSLYKHAEIDKLHSEELWRLIDDLPLLPWHAALLGTNAFLVIEQIACFHENLFTAFNNE
jgi:hypothetical protein